MSTDKQPIANAVHDDVSRAPFPFPEAPLSPSAPPESLRQADEPPSEATIAPKAGRAGSRTTTAERLTDNGPFFHASLRVHGEPDAVIDPNFASETPLPAPETPSDNAVGADSSATDRSKSNATTVNGTTAVQPPEPDGLTAGS